MSSSPVDDDDGVGDEKMAVGIPDLVLIVVVVLLLKLTRVKKMLLLVVPKTQSLIDKKNLL